MGFGYQRNSSLLDGKYREFLIPTVLTAMATSMSIIVDGIIVGNFLGANALAAVNVVTPILMIYITVAVSLGMGAATVIAVAKGRREESYANDVFTVSLLAMLSVSVVLMIVQALFLDKISLLLTSEAVLLPLVKEFYRVLIYGTPAFVLITGMVYCLRTDGKAKLASVVLLTANVINLLLDLVYIGLFDMGIGGAALATVSGYVIGFAVLISYVFAKDRTLKVNVKLLSKPVQVLQCVERIFITGMPGASSSILMTLKILCINTIILNVAGSSGMVAFSVCISCLSLISMFISGAAQTMAPIVGALYGEKDFVGIRFVVKRAFQILVFAGIVTIALLQFFPEAILALFGVTHAADLTVGVPAIRIFSVSLMGTSLTYLMLYYYMTTGRRKLANAISVVQGFVIVVPGALILSKLIGIDGVWIAFVLAEAVTIMMIMVYYLDLKKRSAGRYKDVLLLDNESDCDCKILDLTIRSSIEQAVGVSEKTIEFLGKRGVEAKLCNKVGMVIEEMAVNTARHGYKRGKAKNYIDIRIKILAEEIVIVLRDDGDFFDPTKFLNSEKEQNRYLIGGIELVNAIARKVEYSRVLGLNNTTITLDSRKALTGAV